MNLAGLSLSAQGKKIGLYGGSFNPPHSGHLHIAKSALQKLDLDEVWILVSPGNPLKEASKDMAPFDRRLEVCSQFFTAPRIKVLGLEKALKTRYSVDTVKEIRKRFPKSSFVWIMGADNAEIFHLWAQWRDIVHILPIAIFDRTGYSMAGRHNRLTREFYKDRQKPKDVTKSIAPSWCFVPLVRNASSASMIRQQLKCDWWGH
ncbi:nicotinate (nicotinamide) nucleotide adenylyltransferase [Temperatibacter marinus]|uniref:Probable nicotinate-nucleotide adenylyltransferase n=1 Tax=Temperatibacter marinus TaxID=1456591 RepID=A0AA52H7U5_9PROT|nr:nicotinate (nicotinamide) nucleotide adenylyltransferase [Temperatibacter marinus]WND01446.1 nicotinate (nicotinamide) nucleotide adenylyltransferase [Temperatibacter marinus]